MGINPLEMFPKHFMLNYKNRGACKTLVGNVAFYFFAVNDPESRWDEVSLQGFKSVCNMAISCLERQAREYGASLKIKYAFDSVTTNDKVGFGNWRDIINSALGKYSFKSVDEFQEFYEKKHGLDDSCIILAFNKKLRGFASVATEGYTDFGECCFIGKSQALFRHTSIVHEVLHQFGAKDYYYPEPLKESAKLHIGDSVMMTAGCERIDPLTAYLVGWTDEVDMRSGYFLRVTSNYTQKDIDDAIRAEHRR